MRVTKAQLQKALDDAARFNRLPLVFIPPGCQNEDLVRASYWFIPVCQYGRGMLPLPGEIGTDISRRFLRTGAQ